MSRRDWLKVQAEVPVKFRIRQVGVLLATAAAAIGISAIPAQAAPAAGGILFISADTTYSSSGSSLVVQMNDGSSNLALTSVSVHVFSDSGHTNHVMDVAMTATDTSSPSDQTFTSTDAITTLAPGTYYLTIDATDGTNSVSGLDAGTLPFDWLSTSITGSFTTPTIKYGQHDTISGQLTGASPDGGPTAGIPNVPVDLTNILNDSTTQITMTNSKGNYSVSVTPTGVEYVVETPAAPGVPATGCNCNIDLGFGSNYATRISANVTPKDFVYGKGGVANLTGTAQYQVKSGSAWKPLANSVVYASGGSGTAYLTTDGNGNFSWQFTPTLLDGGSTWTVLTDAPGTTQSQASGSVHIAVPVQFTAFTASLSPFGALKVTACAATPVAGAFVPRSAQIQYSASPSGPWKKLGTIKQPTVSTTTCNPNDFYGGTLGVKLGNAYYRAFFPASPDNLVAASKPLHRFKAFTRIVSLTVSPGSVAPGGQITVKGRLEQQVGKSWRSYAHRTVLIVLRPRGSKKWYFIKKVVTNSRGAFGKTFTDPVTAAWSAAYEGDKTHFASSGKIFNVTVTAVPGARWRPEWLQRPLSPVHFPAGLRG
jgi:hypothetical protein